MCVTGMRPQVQSRRRREGSPSSEPYRRRAYSACGCLPSAACTRRWRRPYQKGAAGPASHSDGTPAPVTGIAHGGSAGRPEPPAPPAGSAAGCACGNAAVQFDYAAVVPASAISTRRGETAGCEGAGRNGAAYCGRPGAPSAHLRRQRNAESAVGGFRTW